VASTHALGRRWAAHRAPLAFDVELSVQARAPFNWIPSNPCGEVRKPKFRVKVRAFTAAEVATLSRDADDATRVLIQTAAHTGLRIGELAGLE